MPPAGEAGSVKGYIDDSFCIDEDKNGNLRVATTSWSENGNQESSLYILDKNMKKSDLKEKAGISSASLAKLGKGDNITTDVLLRICEVMDCRIEDILETVRD